MRVLLIDPLLREVRTVECGYFRDLQHMIDGYPELAHRWPDTGDELYVTEYRAGAMMAQAFRISVHPNPWPGRGVLVGREGEGEPWDGRKGSANTPVLGERPSQRGMERVAPVMTAAQLQAMLTWPGLVRWDGSEVWS